jgi:type IV pilus assembly protein PilB
VIRLMPELSKKIGEILIENNAVSEIALGEALALVDSDGIRTGEALRKLGYIGEAELLTALSAQYGLREFNLAAVEATLDEDALKLIPVELLGKIRVAPVKVSGVPVLVTSDPTEILLLDDIERVLKRGEAGAKRVLGLATRRDIDRLLGSGADSGRILAEAASGFHLEDLKVREDEEGAESVLSIEKISQDSSPVIKLVDTTIYDALSKGASDIHLESTDEGLIVKYRLDGVLHKIMGPVDKRSQASIISRIKVMSELDISERRIPQDGRFKIRFQDKAIEFRVSIMPSIQGEDAVIRILDKEHITREFQDLRLDYLGFGADDIKHLRRMIREPYGMILVTGPTGSGKTTTLYAAVSEINTGEDKIITIEDPVEYELKGVIQIPVNEKKGLTFAKGLRSILRHDPDKIMVGEIRDAETAQIAIQAALTGHIVFTTVHANNVFDVIGRFIHMGIEPYNFVSSLNCVLAQRLIRLICPACRQEAKMTPERLLASKLDPDKYAGKTFYEGAGCSECYNTGYKNRKAIIELLDITDEIRDMIAAKEPPSAIKKTARAAGMTTLREVAIACVVAGETSLDEIDRVTFVE